MPTPLHRPSRRTSAQCPRGPPPSPRPRPLAGEPPAAGGDLAAGEHELRGLRPGGHRRRALPVRPRPRRRRDRDPLHADRDDAGHLARRRARACRVGQRYGFRADGPWEPARGRLFNPAKLLLDPYARAVSGSVAPTARSTATRPRPGRRRGARRAARVPLRRRLRAVRPAHGGRARRLRLGRRRPGPAAHPVDRHRRLRAARQGLHRSCTTEVPEDAPRDVRRARPPRPRCTTSRTSASPPSSCCRCTSSPPSRDLARRGLTNYWGYNSIGFFAPHAAYCLDRRPRRAGHRVQGDGQGAARGRARGDPRRGLQPHRRGQPARADAVFRGLDDIGYYKHVDWVNDGRDVLGRHRLRQHRRRRVPAGAAADPGLAALLGHRDARRRLPLRPDAGADPHRPPRRPGRALHLRDRPGPGAAAREADRRAVGRQHGRLPGRPVPAAVVRVERPVPRHGARLLARSSPAGSATSPRGWPGPATCTPTTAARRTPRSTSSPRTTASRCATWSPTTASTTRPTSRTTATAPTTTGPGTAASRARPTTRR